MSRRMADWLCRLRACFQDEEKYRYLDDRAVLAQAHRDWMAARKLFEFTTEPDLVDYAIHSLQAAERRYIYLWKKARQKG